MNKLELLVSNTAQLINENDINNVPKTALGENIITNALQMVFGIFAGVAVLIIAIAAFRIIISRGNPQDVSRSRDAIIYAAIGLAVSMMAFTIVTFVVEGV